MSADLRARLDVLEDELRDELAAWEWEGPNPSSAPADLIATILGVFRPALEQAEDQLDAKDAEIGRLTIGHESLKQACIEALERAEQAEADLARSKDVAIREAEQVRSERNRYAERAEQAEALADEHAANARDLGERLRQAEAERDQLRAADGRVKAAIRPLAEQKIPIVGTSVILEALTQPIDLAALDQAPAAEQDGGGE